MRNRAAGVHATWGMNLRGGGDLSVHSPAREGAKKRPAADGRRRALFVPMIAADVAPSDSERFAFVPPALFFVFAVDTVAIFLSAVSFSAPCYFGLYQSQQVKIFCMQTNMQCLPPSALRRM